MNKLIKLRNDINEQLDFRFRPQVYNPTTFTLITGTDAVLDEVWSYQVVNKIKNHYYAAAAPADIQNGMIFIDSDDGKVYIRHGGSTTCITDIIEEGNSKVEVVDAGTGYITTEADASEVRRDQVLGNLQPLQPCFLARPTANQTDIAVDSPTTIVFGTEVFDVGANFATNTFTAPVTGKYYLSTMIRLVAAVDNAANDYRIYIVTSNRSYYNIIDPGGFQNDLNFLSLGLSVVADMDATDTAYVVFYQNVGAQQCDVHTDSYFSGALIC